MNLLALDLSLTSTGWAAKHGADPVASGTYCPRTRGVERLEDGFRWTGQQVSIWRPDLVVIEGYSFASQTAHARAAGEFGGVVRLRLHQAGVRYVELAPKTRAKLATGKGNAGKEQVLAEAIRRLGYAGHSNDEADALWLLHAALIAYRLQGAARLPMDHTAALEKVEWPDVPLARAS